MPTTPSPPATPATAPGTASAAASPASMGRASAVMAAGTAVSRALGLVRVAFLALLIGATGASSNAFSVANTVPNMLYLLIAGGVLNAVLVPQVTRALQRPDGGADYLNRLITAAVLALAVITAVLVAAAPLIIGITTLGADPAQRALALAFALWCLPQVFFYALYTLLGQVLNARGRFGAYMWAPAVNNVVALAGLGAFALTFGTIAPATDPASWTPAQVALLAGTSTAGVIAQALVLLVPLRRAGVRLRPRWGLRGIGLRSAGTVAGWTFGALLLNQTAAVVITNVGQSVQAPQAAGTTIWNNAFLVFMLPHSLVTVSLVTALFTRMSTAAAAGDLAALRADASRGLRTIAVATVLASAGLVVLHDAAGVLLAGGSLQKGQVLGRVLLVLAFALVPFSAAYLVQRGFYALEEARTPFVVQLVTTALWVASAVGALALPEADRIAGVAVGLVISQWVGALLGLALLHRRLTGLEGRRVLGTHLRLLLAGVVAAAAGLAVASLSRGLLERGYLGAGLVVVIAGGAVTVVYAAGVLLLRVTEVAPLRRRLQRGRRRNKDS